MSFSHKKFFILLIVVISVGSLILFKQILVAKNIVTAPSTDSLISSTVLPIPLDYSEPTLGNPGAALSIIEFTDLGCDKCRKTHKILASFVSNHPTEAKLIWKDLPNQEIFSRDHRLAHQAAWCAGNQKQFWPFIDKVLQRSDYNKESGLKIIAQDLRLNISNWWQCTTDLKTRQKIDEAINFANQLNIRHTPTIFINNKKINLKKDFDLEQFLNSLLEK